MFYHFMNMFLNFNEDVHSNALCLEELEMSLVIVDLSFFFKQIMSSVLTFLGHTLNN